MATHLQRQDCSFCRYYDAQHDATRCHCASCWRRRDRVAHQTPQPPSSSSADASGVTAAATAVSPSTRLRTSPQTAGGASTRCKHGAVPFHHCRLCVFPPYFHHAPAQWDGHAVVCAPHYACRDGCGCSLRCECRRRRETGEHARHPQYAVHELPVMGARAALYSKP